MRKIAAYIERDPESGLYVGTVPGIPGAHTQGETLDELHKNLKEVLELCLEELGTDEIPDGRRTTIPHHGSRLLARPLIRAILREIELNVDEYNDLIDRI
jgi:predicted RNase H-like HicB family nuclease